MPPSLKKAGGKASSRKKKASNAGRSRNKSGEVHGRSTSSRRSTKFASSSKAESTSSPRASATSRGAASGSALEAAAGMLSLTRRRGSTATASTAANTPSSSTSSSPVSPPTAHSTTAIANDNDDALQSPAPAESVILSNERHYHENAPLDLRIQVQSSNRTVKNVFPNDTFSFSREGFRCSVPFSGTGKDLIDFVGALIVFTFTSLGLVDPRPIAVCAHEQLSALEYCAIVVAIMFVMKERKKEITSRESTVKAMRKFGIMAVPFAILGK